ncbi:hypothetical protein [Rhodoferax aquaticus]|uniref:DUF721 domain-containing protein n=1 Tax=Rhodoferax aquaticus TaxID=2527691 RepID=A0A515ESI0_9BURK|nr:hypothetical protein [Rhodoferax aquaticus]QDL55619.1 hypothetical protein EXZ61_16365 [Rhodoferax aquaticus]
MNRRSHSISVLQATQDSPTFAQLSALVTESAARLQAIDSLIPTSLRKLIQAGPIDGANWCIIVDNNAVAAKIRQLQPAIEAHLRSKGWDVTAIRLKVSALRKSG